MITATFWADYGPIVPPTAALLGVLLTLWINGDRAERQRRRELHARALKATTEYAEMPFAIRRRRHEPEQRSAERVRLTARFSDIQAEIAACQALLDADGKPNVARAYADLVQVTRSHMGQAARDAWNAEPIQHDDEVNMPDVAKILSTLEPSRAAYVKAMQDATVGVPERLRRWATM